MAIRHMMLTLLLIVLTAAGGSASDKLDNVKVGDMTLSFSPSMGFQVDFGGASVFTESSLHVVRPCWVTTYYAYEAGGEKIDVNDIPGGKEIVVGHHSPTFDGEHRVSVHPNSVTFDLRYKLTTNSTDAGIEYNIGYLAAPLITGCSFSTESESGTIPQAPLPTGDVSVTKNTFRRMAISSRIGKIIIETNGDPDNLQLNDYRGLHVDWAQKNPILMISSPRKVLKEGEEYRSVVTITFEPLQKTKGAEVAKQGTTAIKEISDLHKTVAHPVVVIPEPKEMRLSTRDFLLNKDVQIVVGKSAKEEDLRGVRSFANEIRTRYNIPIKIVREGSATAANLILVGESSLNSKLKAFANSEKLTAPKQSEGYSISVAPHKILVLGRDRKGTFYGMQTLKQLVKVSYENVVLQGCRITDYPTLSYRGALLFMGNEALPFHKKLIDRIFSHFKLNNLMFECDQIKWDSTPEIATSFAMSHADVRKDIRYAQDHFMEVTPLVCSLACRYLFNNNQHLDLAEDPRQPYTYCPSKQASYDLMFKIYDEMLDLFDNPKYVHIGHDEVTWDQAEFPHDAACKQKSIPDLFLGDIQKVYDHLKSKGSNVMMWSDMMLSPGTAPDACNMPDPKEAERIRLSIPKDIVVTDWHYDIAKPEGFKSIKAFQDAGHRTIASTWFTPENIVNFSQEAKNRGADGLLQTLWAGTNSNEQNLKDARSQFTAFVLAAEYAWNSGKTPLDKLPYNADDAFFDAWNQTAAKRESLRGFVVDLSRLYNAPLSNEGQNVWVGSTDGGDLSSAPKGTVRLGDDVFCLGKSAAQKSSIRLSSAIDGNNPYPKSIAIPVGQKADSLLFLHTCAWSDAVGRRVGSYIVNYEDGSSVEIPLVYRENIAAWTEMLPCASATIAWKNEKQRISLRELKWQNPRPDARIMSIEMRSEKTNAGPVLLGISGLSADKKVLPGRK